MALRPFVIALSGGIASGKSALGRRFAEQGIPQIDADIAAREVVAPGQPALLQIAERFGSSMLNEDGSLNRRALRERVFSDAAMPTDRSDLEAMIHPGVRLRLRQQVDECATDVVMLAIPLLVEARADYGWVDRVLMVDVPESVQIARLCERDHVDRAAAMRMLAAQSSRQQRLAIADDVVVNDGPIAALDLAAARLAAFYGALATRAAA